MEMITVLIDKEPESADIYGYVYGFTKEVRQARYSFHRVIENHATTREENFKVIGCGSVYIFNHNPETYKPKRPETFEEYMEDKYANI